MGSNPARDIKNDKKVLLNWPNNRKNAFADEILFGYKTVQFFKKTLKIYKSNLASGSRRVEPTQVKDLSDAPL
jgi:hypothetical protein